MLVFFAPKRQNIDEKKRQIYNFRIRFWDGHERTLLIPWQTESDKGEQWRRCPDPMRKENLYTVSLLYIRGLVESITAFCYVKPF